MAGFPSHQVFSTFHSLSPLVTSSVPSVRLSSSAKVMYPCSLEQSDTWRTSAYCLKNVIKNIAQVALVLPCIICIIPMRRMSRKLDQEFHEPNKFISQILLQAQIIGQISTVFQLLAKSTFILSTSRGQVALGYKAGLRWQELASCYFIILLLRVTYIFRSR